MRHWLAIGLLGLCVGCGFHLRGQEHSFRAHPGPWQLESSASVSMDQSQALQEALSAAGATLSTQQGLRICLDKSESLSEPLAFGIDGEVRRERLTVRVTFSLMAGENTLLPPQVLSRSQERIRYANYDLSDASDKEKIVQDLQADLAHQILLRLDLWSQSRPRS